MHDICFINHCFLLDCLIPRPLIYTQNHTRYYKCSNLASTLPSVYQKHSEFAYRKCYFTAGFFIVNFQIYLAGFCFRSDWILEQCASAHTTVII